MCCRPGAAPAQLAASRVRDSARRDIGGWGRGRRGGAKAALVMVQLARPRSLPPLPGARGWAVRFLLRPLVRVVPATRAGGGFCSIRSCLTACRRRVVALMLQFPPRATAWWHGWRPGRPALAPRPRLAPQAPGPPGPRVAHPGACGTRSTLLSVVFQAFARNSALPLHLGALSRKWPLDVGVRHAQAAAIKCDA